MVVRDPDDGIGGRALLAVIAAVMIAAGLFLGVMSAADIDGPGDGLVIAAGLGGGGVLGLAGAVVGRVFGRWLLAGFGVLLIGSAVAGFVESLPRGPGRFGFVMFGSMVVFGVAAMVMAFRSMVALRRRRRSGISPSLAR